MEDKIKNAKISLIISVFSVFVSLIGIIVAIMHLRYSIDNGKATGSAITSFWCMFTIFWASLTQFILNRNRYKKYSQ